MKKNNGDEVFFYKPKLDTAEEARDFAIRWQAYMSANDLSLGELASWNDYFHNIGIQFDLTDEFIENGIL